MFGLAELVHQPGLDLVPEITEFFHDFLFRQADLVWSRKIMVKDEVPFRETIYTGLFSMVTQGHHDAEMTAFELMQDF